MGRDEDQVFIVQEYIEGQDLDKYLTAQTQLPIAEQTARLMMAIAEAVAFAHQKGFVHRDLKPANILLDTQQRPRVADFGLAVHETIQRRRRGELSGTPAYMSPEQVRGETHRLDGRSDIWSLGVILYEMLSGRRPFSGDHLSDLIDEIIHRDPKPPRPIQQQVPAELERICLKCLAKRVTDRYLSALDLASDLQHWLSGGQQPSGAAAETRRIKIVLKGLRSFDEGDADFFLELLPGPRDRDGLPESIRFWKTRLEETDADRTFAVGLVYGPSGCGKSSLMKAGLLPRLASHVLPIYVEATAADTEVRLLKGLRKACPEIPADVALPDVFESLRQGIWLPRGRKIVIVLDQFEQWLHAHRAERDTQLVHAPRQCDGGRLQAIVMVRDDFSMAASRFMKDLETRIVEGHNFATVDLFDVGHAENVLTKFGQAFGKLSAQTSDLSEDPRALLASVASGLAQDGKVVSVRLSLFAEMVKGRPWIPVTLEQIGGTQGIGVNFLEETFSARDANPEHRLHQQAARAVLKSLLPEVAAQIVAVSSVFLRDWMVALRPVRDRLLAPLSAIYRDAKRRESERSLATDVLADYAADQPTVLVDLVQDADETQFAVVFPRLQQHAAPARKLLEAALAQTLAPDWQDPPLPASWRPAEAALATQIEAADGLVAERFAFCQTMPLDQFVTVSQALKASGYRPTRVRPHRSPHAPREDSRAASGTSAVLGSAVRGSLDPAPSATFRSQESGRPAPSAVDIRVAAVWTRDGRDFLLTHDATLQELLDRDAKVRQEGFLPADVAGYVTVASDSAATERYAALWIKRASDTDDARLFPGLSDTNTLEQTQLRESGYRYVSMQQRLGSDGHLRFSSILRKQDLQTTASFGQDEQAYASKISLGELQHDISTSPAALAESSRDRYTRMLTQAEQALKAKADDPAALRQRAVARCGLHQDAEAVEDLTALLAKNPKDSEAYQLRAISHARQGNKGGAAADLADYAKFVTDLSQVAYLDAVVASWQGDATGLERLQAALATHEQDSTWLYNAACAYAIAAKAFEKDAERSASCAADAVKLLQRAVAAGYTNVTAIRDDFDLESIRDRAEFREILAQGRLDRSYSSVWQASAAFESVELHGLPPQEHLAKCRELLKQDYRPVAIAAFAIAPHPSPLPGVPGRGDQRVSGPSPQASSLTSQASNLTPQASFLACSVWQRPRIATDSRLALAKRQAGAAIALLRQGERDKIFSALRVTDDPESLTQFVHRCRAGGVSVGELWECVQLAQRNRPALQGELRRVEDRVLFGLLLAMGEFSWGELPEALREPAVTQVAKLYREDPSSTIHGATGWLLRQWQQADVARHVDETPVAYDQQREWFTLVIPVGEQKFIQTYVVIAPGEYEIGSPLDRQKYPADPDEAAKGAPRNWPVNLARRGFRLPTESEWEIAARGGMRTTYGFGADVSLLDRYGWFQDNSGKRAHVPRELRPNARGLFDLHGNVYEWCHDWYGTYALEGSRNDPTGLLSGSSRVYRGGGWSFVAAYCRAAYRSRDQPTDRNSNYGLRVALVPFSPSQEERAEPAE